MTLRDMIAQIAGDFGAACSIVVSRGDDTAVHIEENIYPNVYRDAHPYVFFPKDADPIEFDVEHITQIVVTRNGICVCISIP